jgi:hypothetical protein
MMCVPKLTGWRVCVCIYMCVCVCVCGGHLRRRNKVQMSNHRSPVQRNSKLPRSLDKLLCNMKATIAGHRSR